MKCATCNAETITETTIEEYFEKYGWIDNIVISECTACGIQYYTPEQARDLDNKVKELKDAK